MKSKNNRHLGIGLIEVLVALVVVSLGLLALASFQGDLMSSSGETKARAEAITIAEQKIEDIRNYAQASDFALIVNSVAPHQSITGTNQAYTVSWVVTDNTDPTTKTVTVNVAWTGDSVSLSTDVGWADQSKSAGIALADGNATLAPSPNNESSFEDQTTFTDEDGDGSIGVDTGDGSGLQTVTVGDDIYLIDPVTGVSYIRFVGGIMHTIKGTVYVEGNSGAVPSTTYPVAFSDLGYCVFPIPNTVADYVCYFGGDCSNGGQTCPAAPNQYEDIQGGWYGKVGLLEPSRGALHNKKVCFGEDINGNGFDTVTTTARSFAARRVDVSNNAINSEGRNRSSSCQNFLVVDKAGNSYPCASVAAAAGINVPSSSIERILGYSGGTEVPNTVLADDTSACGTLSNYIVSGAITGSSAGDVVVTLGGQVCPINISGGAYTYYCEIDSSVAPSLIAYNGGVSPAVTNNFNVGTNTQDLATGVITSYPETDYVITGDLLGAEADNVVVAVGGGTCTHDYTADTYSCEVTSTATSISMTATNSGTGTVSPASISVAVFGIASVVGPDFTGNALVAPTAYTIAGNLLGAQASNITVTLSGGTCTKPTTTTYSCTITTADSSVTLNASATGGATVSPSSSVVNLSGVASVTGPDFTANSTPKDFTITGALQNLTTSGKNKEPDQVTVTSNAATSSCQVVKSGSNYTYLCTITTTASNVTINASTAFAGKTITPASILVDLSSETSGSTITTGAFTSN